MVANGYKRHHLWLCAKSSPLQKPRRNKVGQEEARIWRECWQWGSDGGLDDQQTCPVHVNGLRMHSFTPVFSIPLVKGVAVKQAWPGTPFDSMSSNQLQIFFPLCACYETSNIRSPVFWAKIAFPSTPQGHIQKKRLPYKSYQARNSFVHLLSF